MYRLSFLDLHYIWGLLAPGIKAGLSETGGSRSQEDADSKWNVDTSYCSNGDNRDIHKVIIE